MRLSRHVAFCLLLLLPATAHADDIGPAQAQALQQQLKEWLAGLLGPSVKLPDLPWQVTGAHDHYVITWPIPGLTVPSGEAATITSVRPLDAGRWSIDAMTMPPSGSFHMPIPDTHDVGPMLDVTYTIGRQDTHGVLDPGFATASAVHTEIGDLVVATSGASQRQEQRVDRYVVDTSLTPAANGRLDLAMDGTIDGWKSASEISSGTPVAIGVQKLRVASRINGVNRDRVTGLLAAFGGLIGALPPDIATKGNKGDLPAPARAQLRLVVAALQDVLTSASIEESLDGVQVEIAGMGGLSMKLFQIGFGGESPDGRLHAWLGVGLDELASPTLPPNVAAYLPHHLEFKPSISGVLTADLHKLALDATQEGADSDSLAPDIAAIFSHGGIGLGVETLAFDLGPAKIAGAGHATMLSPDWWHAEAHLTATGLDDLAIQARTNPDLQQALPVLIMLRGLAKQDGGRLVWDIVSDGPTVTVNGLDLSQLGNADQPKPPPTAEKPVRPPAKPGQLQRR